MADYPGAAPPPEGVTPDMENPHDSLRTVLYVTQAVTLLFVTLFIGMRVYAKAYLLRNTASWDDVATYASYVLMIGYCITAICAAHYGGGYNLWEVSIPNAQGFFKSSYAATIFYAPMALSVKMSLLLIIIRVFGSVHTKTLMGIYVLIAIIVLYYVSGVFIKIFICWPISAYWKGETDKCMDQSAIITADAIISVISDLAILLLPVPLTWNLQMPTKRRLRIIGMLAAGGIATAFSVYRLILIVADGKSANQSIVFAKVLLSGNAEAGIGLICACLPAANAIVAKFKSSSYYASHSRSGDLEGTGHGEIMMTRSFHVDSTATTRSPKHLIKETYDIGHDQAGLTSDVQANPRSNYSYTPSRSGSTD